MSPSTSLESIRSLVHTVDRRTMTSEAEVSAQLDPFDHIQVDQPPPQQWTKSDHTEACSLLEYLRGRRAYAVGDISKARKHYTQSIEACKQAGDTKRQAVAISELAFCHGLLTNGDQANNSILSAIDLARRTDDAWTIGRATYRLAALQLLEHTPEESLATHEQALAMALDANDEAGAIYAEMGAGLCLCELGRHEDAVTRIERSAARCEATRLPLVEAYVTGASISVLTEAGRAEAAIEASERWAAMEGSLAAGHAAAYLVFSAEAHLEAGNLDQAEAFLERVDDGATGADSPGNDKEFYAARARLRAARQDFRGAYDDMMIVASKLEDAGHRSREQTRAIQAHHRAELVATNSELLKANTEKQEILEAVAHDLRSPIAAIKFLAQSEERSAGSDRSPQSLKATIDLANEMSETIRGILDPTQAAMIGPTKIDDLVKQVVSRHRPSAEQRGIRLHHDESDTIVLANRDRLRRVIDNLLSNSVKYTPDGGEIRITVSQTDDTATIEVADTGRGFTEAQLRKVLQEPPAETSSTVDTPSLGLGLAIAKRFAQEMGGDVSVSSPGADLGTVAHVRVPSF